MSTYSYESENTTRENLSSDDGSDNDSQFQQSIQHLLETHHRHKKEKLRLLKQVYVQNFADSSQRSRTRTYVDRQREIGHEKLVADYFADRPVYTDVQFRRRFRMRRQVFLRIVESLENKLPFFQPKPDATGRSSISGLVKCTAALRVLAYGAAYDQVDEYLRIGEATTRECLREFVIGVISIFGEKYLRCPNEEDIRRLLYYGRERGFPGMLGSIDCMHWEWKNCPIAWKGQFAGGHKKKPTLVLEVVVSYDLWFWHSFFGTPGTCNDITVLDRSPVFNDLLEGRAPPVQYSINGHQYDMGYYLADGIYPPWATFVQSISLPQDPKAQLFAQHQEAARKDVERAFGVLQARFAILRQPCNIWDGNLIGEVMRACIILHNIIVEDERDTYSNYCDPSQWDDGDDTTNTGRTRWTYSRTRINDMETYIRNQTSLRDRAKNSRLKFDLIENIWEKYGVGN